MEKMLLKILILIYYNWLINLNIFKNIKKMYTPFNGTHVTYYIKFKLLYVSKIFFKIV